MSLLCWSDFWGSLQCKQYDTEGFVIVRKLFSKNEILEIARHANLLKEMAFKLANNIDDKVMHKSTQFVISHKNKKPSIAVKKGIAAKQSNVIAAVVLVIE